MMAPRSDIGQIADIHVSVAFHARRKCNEIADHAVMFNIASDIAMEMPPDTDIAGEGRERGKYSTFAYLYLVHSYMAGRYDFLKRYSIACAFLRQILADTAICNCNGYKFTRIGLREKIFIRQDIKTVYCSVDQTVIDENRALVAPVSELRAQ